MHCGKLQDRLFVPANYVCRVVLPVCDNAPKTHYDMCNGQPHPTRPLRGLWTSQTAQRNCAHILYLFVSRGGCCVCEGVCCAPSRFLIRDARRNRGCILMPVRIVVWIICVVVIAEVRVWLKDIEGAIFMKVRCVKGNCSWIRYSAENFFELGFCFVRVWSIVYEIDRYLFIIKTIGL